MKTYILIALCFSFLVGCSTYKIHNAYEGKPLPNESVARLYGISIPGPLYYGQSTIFFLKANREPFGDGVFPSEAVLPGKMTIYVWFQNARYQTFSSFEINAEAGKEYVVNFEQKPTDHFSPMKTDGIWLQDKNTGQHILQITGWDKISDRAPVVAPIIIHM